MPSMCRRRCSPRSARVSRPGKNYSRSCGHSVTCTGSSSGHPEGPVAEPVSLSGGAMIRRTYLQRNLIEVLRADGDKLWDDTLREIDAVLDDEEVVDLVDAALRGRRPQSATRGRLGTPVVVVLRMLVLKHLYDWSFAECEREVRGSLVYRAFCRIDCERVPDAKTLIRLAALLGPEALKGIVTRLVHIARERRGGRGARGAAGRAGPAGH